MVLEPEYLETPEDMEYDRSRVERATTRSTFERHTTAGTLTPSINNAVGVVLLAGLGSGFMNRIKRVAVTFVVPKTTTATVGYLGFVRIPEGLRSDFANLAFNDPALLRPTLYISNTDNATYWNAYLPAVNLVDTGVLWLVGRRVSGSSSSIDYVARWILERTST